MSRNLFEGVATTNLTETAFTNSTFKYLFTHFKATKGIDKRFWWSWGIISVAASAIGWASTLFGGLCALISNIGSDESSQWKTGICVTAGVTGLLSLGMGGIAYLAQNGWSVATASTNFFTTYSVQQAAGSGIADNNTKGVNKTPFFSISL